MQFRICAQAHDGRIAQRRLVQILQEVHDRKEWGDGEVDFPDQALPLPLVVEDGIALLCDLGRPRVVLEEGEGLVGVGERVMTCSPDAMEVLRPSSEAKGCTFSSTATFSSTSAVMVMSEQDTRVCIRGRVN